MIVGEGRLREVFLKTDNDFGGKYFAQLIKVSSKVILLSKMLLIKVEVAVYTQQSTIRDDNLQVDISTILSLLVLS